METGPSFDRLKSGEDVVKLNGYKEGTNTCDSDSTALVPINAEVFENGNEQTQITESNRHQKNIQLKQHWFLQLNCSAEANQLQKPECKKSVKVFKPLKWND